MERGNLVIGRTEGESIRIGTDIDITVVSFPPGKVRLAIRAPKDVPVMRSELLPVEECDE